MRDAGRSKVAAASALNAVATDAAADRPADLNGLTEGRNAQGMQQRVPTRVVLHKGLRNQIPQEKILESRCMVAHCSDMQDPS
jgi:hypothetical protein